MDVGRPQTTDRQSHDSAANRTEMREYWRQQMLMQSARGDNGNRNGLDRYLNPRINVDIRGFDRVFGTNVIDIKAQGNVQVICGVDIS